MTTRGVQATGKYTWEPRGHNHGGFHFDVTLKDDEVADGHNVYLESKVQGYSWSRLYGVQRKTVKLKKVVYDGAAQYTDDVWLRACRDRGSLRPDNCADTLHYERSDPRQR
ncbi:hypothetical protein [Streptomyces sp. NPDC047981]|uniref:hypothetical protein n=1 Tax=Streptomyces sp. NPDC047981 TaxID=3154610 RepID=UPI0034411699